MDLEAVLEGTARKPKDGDQDPEDVVDSTLTILMDKLGFDADELIPENIKRVRQIFTEKKPKAVAT